MLNDVFLDIQGSLDTLITKKKKQIKPQSQPQLCYELRKMDLL